MNLEDFIKAQQKNNNKTHQKNDAAINENLINLWNSNSEIEWNKALDYYWELVRFENINIEKKMENLDPNKIKNLNIYEFYDFLYNEYFVWKYTAKNRLATTRRQLQRYIAEERLPDLDTIKNNLFSFDLIDIKLGLEIATYIHGLGVAGASGLLALLFPEYFGTVDQFVVKALKSIDNLKEKQAIHAINPTNIKIPDAVKMIEIMREKANILNIANKTNKWTPRKIDKVLWAYCR